jgi:hypothetical protein
MHPDVLSRRARQNGWDVQPTPAPSGLRITLLRGVWRLDVAFADRVPQAAAIAGPDCREGRPVNLRSINGLLRATPREIGERARKAIAGRPPAPARTRAYGSSVAPPPRHRTEGERGL